MIKIIITGKSGSGKSTLAAKLRAQGLRQAKLHVMGPKREHHNEEEYIHCEYEPKRWDTDKLAQKSYDKWKYILYLNEAIISDFAVLSPAMIEQYKLSLKRFGDTGLLGFIQYVEPTPMIIYLDYLRDLRLIRIEKRDGKITDEAVRRLQSDEEDFQDFKDYTIRVDSDFLYP